MSHTVDEIRQQPAALERTLAEEAPRAAERRARFEKNPPKRVVLVARGTSDNAALVARYLIEITTGIPAALAAPSVTTLYRAPLDWSDALVVGISQSGESTDINACLETARDGGARTIGITNEAMSAMASIADDVLLVHAGRERSVAATKTYTGQLLAGYLLAHALGGAIDLDALRRLPETADLALRLSPGVTALSERYRYMEQAVVIARGLNYANALELSLKLMETSYVVAQGFSGADFAHGPIAMVEKDFPVFVFAAPGPTSGGTRDMLARLRGLQAETVVLAQESDPDSFAAATRSVAIPDAPKPDRGPADLYTPIPFIIPAQLFAASLAEQKGLDPDEPRTLTKVTKTL